MINTCINATGNTPSLMSTVCDKPLMINGPVIARELLLWRTKVFNGSCEITASEGCNDASTASGKDVGGPAEIMNLSGSSILWAFGNGANPQRAETTHTVELPPYY